MTTNTYYDMNAKNWSELSVLNNQLRNRFKSLTRLRRYWAKHNKSIKHDNNSVKRLNEALNQSEDIKNALNKMRDHIKNRDIHLLDEAVCDFVVDYIEDILDCDSKFNSEFMVFYENVTCYRA